MYSGTLSCYCSIYSGYTSSFSSSGNISDSFSIYSGIIFCSSLFSTTICTTGTSAIIGSISYSSECFEGVILGVIIFSLIYVFIYLFDMISSGSTA
jgi:hypothetical protein